MEQVKTLPGKPLPLGAELSADGVNFSVFSRNGTRVILDIFSSSDDSEPYTSIEFDPHLNRTGDIWHVFVPGIKAGALYMYQVDGPFEPAEGHRFNVNQFLLDPYAKAITPVSLFENLPPNYKTPVDKVDIELSKKRRLCKFPKRIFVDDSFNWEGDHPLNLPLCYSIVYETHLKGSTAGKGN